VHIIIILSSSSFIIYWLGCVSTGIHQGFVEMILQKFGVLIDYPLRNKNRMKTFGISDPLIYHMP
jgi:hypothetical protein